MVNNVEVIHFTFAQKINRNYTTGIMVNLVCCKFATACIMVNNRITITQ